MFPEAKFSNLTEIRTPRVLSSITKKKRNEITTFLLEILIPVFFQEVGRVKIIQERKYKLFCLLFCILENRKKS